MEKLPDITQGLTYSQHSTLLPTKPSADRQRVAADAAKRILVNYPDYGKADSQFAVSMAEFLSYLTPQELAIVMDPRNGIHTRCKFLPTPADINELLAEENARRDQFKPAHTSWNTLKPDPYVVPDPERRKRVVRETLGYDPMSKYARREPDAFETVKDFTSADQLKTKPRPASEQLKQHLRDTGHGHLISTPTQEPQ